MPKVFIYSLAALTTLTAQEVDLDPIVVGADFRKQTLSQSATSVSVIDEATISNRITDSFAKLVATMPNVNFSAGASKGKYIQIRGIGERSQFKTPVNPSVGLIVDGMDLSQFPLAASLFDTSHIEVLRGPQGTRFGATALGGVVVAQSNEPTKHPQGHLEATAGNYGTYLLGGAVGGALGSDRLLGRVSVYKNKSDGFMTNSYLGRDDTNNIDELYAKAALRWLVSDAWTVDMRYLHADVDNGYDAFTLDNSRVSRSDEPGRDSLMLDAVSLTSTYRYGDTMHSVVQASYIDGNDVYGYDEDWSYVGEFDASLWPYSYFDEYGRDRKQWDVDVRLLSDAKGRLFGGMSDWVIGAYYKDYDERLTRNRTKEGVLYTFTHDYDTTTKAIYGQLDTHLSETWTVITGLRLEEWEANYRDSDGFAESTVETLWGAKLGVKYQADADTLYYAMLTRGYKPGGFNADNALSASERIYKTETLYNFDAGIRSSHLDGTLRNRLNLFYGKRSDQQVKVYKEDERSFTDYWNNAAKGIYYGLESEIDYYPNDAWHLYSRIGLLRAKFDEYVPQMEGRAPAQAPKYQYNLGVDYTFAERFVLRSNVEGMGSYYFSNTHDQKSKPYALWNASLSYAGDNWSVTLWGRNLTNKEYAVRGFYFGNNPAKGYESELYTQKGDPRTFGVTLSYDF